MKNFLAHNLYQEIKKKSKGMFGGMTHLVFILDRSSAEFYRKIINNRFKDLNAKTKDIQLIIEPKR